MIATQMKVRIAKLISHPAIGSLVGFVFHENIPFRGVRVRTDSIAVTGKVKAQLFWGIYESAEARLIRKHLRGDLDVIELGGSLGAISSQILAKQHLSRRFITVEPNPGLLEILTRNINIAAKGRSVRVVHGAVFYDGPMAILDVGGESNASALASRADGNTVSVPALTLARLLEDNDVCNYALVADIEGAELAVVRRDAQALRGCRQIIIELHSQVVDGAVVSPEGMAREIQAIGFHVTARRGPVYVFDRV